MGIPPALACCNDIPIQVRPKINALHDLLGLSNVNEIEQEITCHARVRIDKSEHREASYECWTSGIARLSSTATYREW